MIGQYVQLRAAEGADGLRYLSAELVTMRRDARGVWGETGEREPLASFPAPRWGSPWLRGTARHAEAFAFAHPATVEWLRPKD